MFILDVDITPVTLIQNLLRTQLHTLYIYNEPLDLMPVINNELKQLYDDHLHINNRSPDAVFTVIPVHTEKCITFMQCWASVEDVGPTLFKYYINV